MSSNFQQLVQAINPQYKLLRTWVLTGGVSAQVTGLEVEGSNGQTLKLIVRQHGPTDLNRNPNIAAHEFKLLQILHSAGLAVPAPYYLDTSRIVFPTPVIVIEYIEGQPDFAPVDFAGFITQLATHLSKIHTLDISRHDLSFLPRQYITRESFSQRPAIMDASLNEERVWDVLQTVWPLNQAQPALLHGDYWPGNILWKDGQLAAVIDWEDAALGDPLADIANTRLELLWAFGADAVQQFMQSYAALTPLNFTNLPYWDLRAALKPIHKIAGWNLPPGTEQTMRESLRVYITQALQALEQIPSQLTV